MPRTDAQKQEIINALTAAAKPAGDGTLYIRACRAAKIVGCNQETFRHWERDGRITPLRLRVAKRWPNSCGYLVAMPLDQLLACLKTYRPPSERRWMDRDEDRLLELLGTRSVEWIAKELGRTPNAILVRANRLGVCPRTNQGRLTVGQVAGLCRRTRQAVNPWCLKRGLKYSRMPNGHADKLIDPNDLVAFLKQNPKIWDGLPDASRRALERMTADLPRSQSKTAREPDPGPRVYRRSCA